MAEFFSQQMDYIFFFYGLGFLVLAGMAYVLWRGHRDKIQWQWLALFGVIHGLNEWLDLAVIYVGKDPALGLARITCLIVSFACLAEFGRSTLRVLVHRHVRGWVYVPVIIMLLLAYLSGGHSLMNAWARYLLGVGGGILSAAMLLVVSPRFQGAARVWLVVEAGLLLIYALTQSIPAPMRFFPMSAWNTDTFLAIFGFPVQFLRGALACGLAGALWMFWFTEYLADTYRKTKLFLRTTRIVAALVPVVLAGGWYFTQHQQHDFNSQYRRGLEYYGSTLAIMAGGESVAFLTGTPEDEKLVAYWQLNAAMDKVLQQKEYVRGITIWGERQGKIVPLLSHYSEDGQASTNCVPESARLEEVVRERHLSKDCFGFFPVHDRKTGALVAAIGIGLNPVAYEGLRLHYRFSAILVTGIICCVLIGFLIIMFLTRDYAIQVEDAERRSRRMIADLEKAMAQLKQAQDLLVQSERMASIGQLAAGIAHEINNPTAFISLNLEQLEKYVAAYEKVLACVEKIGDDPSVAAQARVLLTELDADMVRNDMKAVLEQSREGIDRIKRIVRDVQNFARHDENVGPADVEQALDSAVNIFMPPVKNKVTINKEYGHVPLVMCNIQRMGQVFLNILVNAVDAIEGEGTITIKTYVAADKVHIEIRDTGEGIPAQNLRRIFDPFFTTKPIGKGTGLGLSISYDIVKKHHGEILVSSDVGLGSCFTIILPLGPGQANVIPST